MNPFACGNRVQKQLLCPTFLCLRSFELQNPFQDSSPYESRQQSPLSLTHGDTVYWFSIGLYTAVAYSRCGVLSAFHNFIPVTRLI